MTDSLSDAYYESVTLSDASDSLLECSNADPDTHTLDTIILWIPSLRRDHIKSRDGILPHIYIVVVMPRRRKRKKTGLIHYS
mmetsp:Transcript_3914/g.4547  ORF Transcript_3914/g.4547 Transcript_3914/m.4547 type:complete len:82 (+) Transcript_3914:176-421(+)